MPTRLDDFSRLPADQRTQRPPHGASASPRAPAARPASPSPDAPAAKPVSRSDPADDEFSRRLSAATKRSQQHIGQTPAHPDSAPQAPAEPAPQCAPVGGGERLIRQGDCITSLARESGHLWRTIWDDPANAELRAAGREPNVLLPDDRVHVPPPREKWEPGQTGMRHRFRRRGEPAVLSLRLMIRDEPLANQPYTLKIDGCPPSEGFTDPEGKLRCSIPGDARRGRLFVGEQQHAFVLELGHMDPVESLSGVQKRLLNLGYECRRTDGGWDRHCDAALRRFQRAHALPETGKPDERTRRSLREVHGS